jgi:hypothetical protein
MLTALPVCKASSAEHDLPERELHPHTLNAEPWCTVPRIEKLLPRCANRSTDKELPNLASARTDTYDPKTMLSRTLHSPMRAVADTDEKPEPSNKNDRRLAAEPTVRKSAVLQWAAVRSAARVLMALPKCRTFDTLHERDTFK